MISQLEVIIIYKNSKLKNINKKSSIYGERYLLVGIGLLKKTKNIDDLSKGMEKTFANINQYFNSGR